LASLNTPRPQNIMKKLIFLLICLITITSCTRTPQGKLLFVEAAPEKGFHYPYYLFIPDGIDTEQVSYLIIEPNNSGFADDNLKKHMKKASRIASKDNYLGNYVSRQLKYPLIVPVFPRTQQQWNVYTQALDRDAMLQKGNELERIDLQLLSIFHDARGHLSEYGFTTHEKFILTGFSAAGTFANRFTLMHPDQVFAVAAGGVNGLLMLPRDHEAGYSLNYPLGISDFATIVSTPFQKEAFSNIPQFYFMGESDVIDAVSFDDAFDSTEREIIAGVMGREMQPCRWNYCMGVYIETGVNVLFKTYLNTGHECSDRIKKDVSEFFRIQITKNL
jgi:hypothetical protein